MRTIDDTTEKSDEIQQVETHDPDEIATKANDNTHVLKSDQDRLSTAQTVWRFKKVRNLRRSLLTLPGSSYMYHNVCRRRRGWLPDQSQWYMQMSEIDP